MSLMVFAFAGMIVLVVLLVAYALRERARSNEHRRKIREEREARDWELLQTDLDELRSVEERDQEEPRE